MRRAVIVVNVIGLILGAFFTVRGDTVAGVLWAAASLAVTAAILADTT